MNIYRRYFKITTGPIVNAVAEADRINDAAHEEYIKLCDEVGAKHEYWHSKRQMVGFNFDTPPDNRLWKTLKQGGYWPKKNSIWGKDLAKRISTIKTKSVDSCLEVFGLHDSPRLFANGHAYWPRLIVLPWDAPIFIVSLPWYDEDLAKLAEYQQKRAAGSYFSIHMDSLLWEPTADMQSIKGWEYYKLIDEWNAHVKKGE